MPQLAAFPKAYLEAMAPGGSMSLRQWIEMAATLDVDGLEFYCEFGDLADSRNGLQVSVFGPSGKVGSASRTVVRKDSRCASTSLGGCVVWRRHRTEFMIASV